MNTLPFDVWLSGFLRWRGEAAKTLGSRLPSEAPALLKEQAELEPMRWEAESWRSDAVGYYYAAKLSSMEGLQREGVAKTALNDIAKAQSFKQLWARENAQGVADVVISRAFKVQAELKRLGLTEPGPKR